MSLQGLAAAAAGQHYERGQISILAAEAVGNPGAHCWPAWLLVAGAHEGNCRIMVDRVSEHGPHNRNIVRDAADVRQHSAQFGSGFAVAFKIERRTHTAKHGLARGHTSDALAFADAGWQFFARHFLELWF